MEHVKIVTEIEDKVSVLREFIDKDDIVGNMMLAYLLANQDDIATLVREKMEGRFYVRKNNSG